MTYVHVYFEINKFSHRFYKNVDTFIIDLNELFIFRLEHNLSEKEALTKIIKERFKLKEHQFIIKSVTKIDDSKGDENA